VHTLIRRSRVWHPIKHDETEIQGERPRRTWGSNLLFWYKISVEVTINVGDAFAVPITYLLTAGWDWLVGDSALFLVHSMAAILFTCRATCLRLYPSRYASGCLYVIFKILSEALNLIKNAIARSLKQKSIWSKICKYNLLSNLPTSLKSQKLCQLSLW